MKVTTKGQVTIPQVIRDNSGIVPGSEVEFVEDHGRIYLNKVEGAGRGRQLVRRMRGLGKVRMSTDQILALTRGRERKK